MKDSWKKWHAVKGEKTRHHPLLDQWGKRTQTCKVWCRVLNILMVIAVDEGSLSAKSAYFFQVAYSPKTC